MGGDRLGGAGKGGIRSGGDLKCRDK